MTKDTRNAFEETLQQRIERRRRIVREAQDAALIIAQHTTRISA